MITAHLPYMKELQTLCGWPEELALREAASFLARLVREPGFLETEILPLFEGGKGASDWYVASRYEGEDGSFSLQVFVWPAGTGTRIHDRFSWGVYCCAVRHRARGALRAPRRRFAVRPRPAEEGLAIVMERRRRRLHGAARRRGHPPGEQPVR